MQKTNFSTQSNYASHEAKKADWGRGYPFPPNFESSYTPASLDNRPFHDFRRHLGGGVVGLKLQQMYGKLFNFQTNSAIKQWSLTKIVSFNRYR